MEIQSSEENISSASGAAASPRRPVIAICLLLAALILAAYHGAGSLGFVNLDDDAYVEFQPMVNQGLRPAAILWAFTGVHSTNWHPLTSLSHILDCSLFGVRPGPMHWENVFLHILNSLLVFLVWRSCTRETWPSAFVAALFALHPLHVESVAWISERKDVLSAFFWLLGLAAWLRYTRLPSAGRYLPVLACFILGLLSKPMIVTFPFTLLLLDYWPLRRWPAKSWRALFIEKLPLFALAVVHAIITFLVQKSSGSTNFGRRLSMGGRIGNALVSYARYLGKTFWPASLSPFYEHPGRWPLPAIGASLLLLAAISWLAWRQRRTRPWFVFGWLWFLGTMVPVIGLVQAGAQSMADRYTYVSLLGIFTILAWAGAGIAARFPKTRLPLAAAVSIALCACLALTAAQAAAWENSVRLYRHGIAVGVDNAAIRYLLALALQAAGHPESEVTAQYREAISLDPAYVNAYTQLAVIDLNHRDFDEARRLLHETLRLEPDNPAIHKNLGALSRLQGKPDEAAAHFADGLRLDPATADLHHELAWMYMQQDRSLEAMHELDTIISHSPWDFTAYSDRGAMHLHIGQRDEARADLEHALWINPAYPDAQRNLRLLSGAGN